MGDLFSRGIKSKFALEVFEKFIGPFVQYMRQNSRAHPRRFIDQFFHPEDRVFSDAVVKRRFKMPGMYAVQANVQIPGYGPRQMEVGDHVTIRADKKMTERVEVEFDRDGEGVVFYLTHPEFELLKSKVEFR